MSLIQPQPDDDESTPTYRQKPRPVGFELTYKLDGDMLMVDSMRRIDRIPLETIEQARFTFKPGNIAATGYRSEWRLKDGRTISIGDTSWRSMIEIERGGERYVRFIRALAAAVAAANPQARFVAGKPPLVWAVLALFGAATLAGVMAFAWIAHSRGATGAFWIALGLGGAIAWQMWPLIQLNRPRPLATGEVPPDLLPAAPLKG